MPYHFHDFELDERLYQLRRGGKPVEIEPKVFNVLAYLLQNRNRIISKDELLEKLWPGQVVSETALTRCIVAARKAVSDDGTKQEVIETQHGRGYRFVATVSERAVERKLAAILHADVKGYSRLMGEDEVGTLRILTAYREVTDSLIKQHRGRIVDTAGDSILAEFASAVDAVQCAMDIQQALRTKNAALSSERRMEFRIGINVGDVIVEGPQIYGDGVNIAARVESLGEAGGICISGTVYDQVENKLPLDYEFLGEHTVKNIAKPVRVYRVVMEEAENQKAEDSASQKAKVKEQKSKIENRDGSTSRSWPVATLAGALLIAATIGTVWYFSRLPLSPQSSALVTGEAKPPSLPLPDKPSIVVLPFVNMSEDPKQEYFSDGITEDLTSGLSRIPSLFVIARNSAFTYKGKAVKVQQISKELGVRYVLEGSVRRAEDQVRVTAQLIDATSGYHLWSESYDRPLTDIFAVQDEITQKIVTTLKLQLALREQGITLRKRTDNLEAYDYLLRGGVYQVRRTKEAVAPARQMYEKAIELDPTYAEAYVRLGRTNFAEWFYRWSPDPQNLERAFELAQKAIALDDSLPLAHSLLSSVYLYKKQPDQAMAEGERAIALDPNDAESSALQANVLNCVSRPEEALRLVQRAMRLNPHYRVEYLLISGFAYRLMGQYAEEIIVLKEAASRSPSFLPAHTGLAYDYVLQWALQQSADAQALAQALAAAQRAVALNDASSWAHAGLGSVYLWQKQYNQAIAETERAITVDPGWTASYALLAEMLSRVSRPEEALELVEQAMRLGPPPTPVADWYFSCSLGAACYLAGRPEEAIAHLKRFLTQHPNRLDAHLYLAAVYNELGKEAEAQAEAAEVLRINPQFSLEVHKQRAPIKDPATLERHIAALRKAGLK